MSGTRYATLLALALAACASPLGTPPAPPPPPVAQASAPEISAPAAPVASAPSAAPTHTPQAASAPEKPAAAAPATVPSQAKRAAQPAAGKQPAAKPSAPPQIAAQAPAPPAAPLPAKKEGPPPLDIKSLKERLKETHAIGVMTKLALKNQVDDLLDQFRAYYAGRLNTSLAELRRPFDMLVMKVLSLLQDGDPALARTIYDSRDAIWGILSDREKFEKYS